MWGARYNDLSHPLRVLRSTRLVGELDRLDRGPGRSVAHFRHVIERENEAGFNLV